MESLRVSHWDQPTHILLFLVSSSIILRRQRHGLIRELNHSSSQDRCVNKHYNKYLCCFIECFNFPFSPSRLRFRWSNLVLAAVNVGQRWVHPNLLLKYWWRCLLHYARVRYCKTECYLLIADCEFCDLTVSNQFLSVINHIYFWCDFMVIIIILLFIVLLHKHSQKNCHLKYFTTFMIIKIITQRAFCFIVILRPSHKVQILWEGYRISTSLSWVGASFQISLY